MADDEQTGSAEVMLKEALAVMVETTTDVVMTALPNGEITYLNASGRKLFGWYDDKPVRGKTIAGIFPEWAYRIVMDKGIPCAIQSNVWEGETALLDQNECEIPVSQIIMAHKDPEGNVHYLSTIMRDISKQKKAEEELRASEQRFARLFMKSPVPAALSTLSEARIIEVNEAWSRLFGYTREEAVGKTPTELEIIDQATHEALAQRISITGEMENAELEVRTRDGRKTETLLSVEYLPFVQENCSLGLLVDISELRHAVREKEKIQKQAWQAQKMETIGQLAAGLAHDFNNVLCVVMGNTELAIQDLSLGKSVDKRMEEIVNASSRASELIHNLLAFSRKQTVQPRILDINRVLKNMHSMLVRLIGEHVVMKILSKPNIGSIKADPVQLEQIVLNLVINARDAMPNGGELIIETADVRRDFSLPGKQVPGSVGDYVMLSVSDTGCGMSARVREKIFEPFFSTKPEGKGTGLGLATVYGIVEQNDGHIEVHSEQGEGTSLKVYFPRESRVIEKQRSEPRSESAGGDETVLLVEDEKSVYEMTMLLLQNLGYKVLSARSGEEALQIAERYKGTIDLLLTDVVMPRMNGRELAQRLAETRTDVKVLYTSGYAQNVIADHGILHDGVHFLAKPYTLTALAAHIRNVLESDHK